MKLTEEIKQLLPATQHKLPDMKTSFSATNLALTWMIGAAILVSSCDYFDEDDVSELVHFEYPADGFYGPNFLTKGTTDYTTAWGSLQAKIPPKQKLKIIITALTPGSQPGTGIWSYVQGAHNWAVYNFDLNTHTQQYISIDGGMTSVSQIQFQVGSFRIDYYENDDTTPTMSKTIQVTE